MVVPWAVEVQMRQIPSQGIYKRINVHEGSVKGDRCVWENPTETPLCYAGNTVCVLLTVLLTLLQHSTGL